MKKTCTLILLILMTSILNSCVGTVEESEPESTDFFDPKTSVFNFPGIISADAISHDKVEIEFFPAFTNGEVNYLLYVNGADFPINLNVEALEDAAGGKLKYLLSGLNMNATYKLKLTANDVINNAVSENENEVFVDTFDNQTAAFSGINEVSLVIGQTDKSIKVEWVPATMNGLFSATAYDPVYYEVTYITSVGGAQNLNNTNYGGSDRKVERVPPSPDLANPYSNPYEVILDNLQPNTTYFIQVRAINQLYYFYEDDPLVSVIPVDKEVNTRFLKLKTTGSTSLFDFDKTSLVVHNPLGDAAFDNIDIFWTPGDGSFDSYMIYTLEYEGSGDATIDDKLTETKMMEMHDNADYDVIPASDTNFRKSSLNSYEWFQVKIVMCRTAACPVDSLDPNFGIISDLRAIRTEPTLAPFNGVIFIDDPSNAAALDEIVVRFEPPVLALGYADKMQVFCIDPNNHTNYSEFDPLTPMTPIADTVEVANCNGLQLQSLVTLNDYNVVVKGVNNISSVPLEQATYCFALAPSIQNTGPANELYLENPDWIVRCISPEIKVPNNDEFKGVKGNCVVNQTSATIGWDLPTDGIYNMFEAYYREVAGADTFNYADAVSSEAEYTSNVTNVPPTVFTDTTVTWTVDNLRPGKTYAFGVLSVADDGSTKLYSEFNLGTVECAIPMPLATFNEWTRIFAIGPKIDGRFPMYNHTTYRSDSFLLEALTSEAVPYEVQIDPDTGDEVDASYITAPGHFLVQQSGFSEVIDGKANSDNIFASKEGIISFAWKDMTLNFLGAEFLENQDQGLRGSREYGYKVYRSDDNKISWIDLTGDSGLIHADNYKYRARTNSITIDEKLAFFTDYSVKFSPDINQVAHARIYWYKVVPYFKGVELAYATNSFVPDQIIKITLPPSNMALIHRKMSNRGRCMEMNKPIDKDYGSHYRCDYNGLGASKKGSPWEVGETVLDQGSDLLMDRYELSCQYTRGDYINNPNTGVSFFDVDDVFGAEQESFDFRGYPTNLVGGHITGSAFKGCTFDKNAGFEASNDSATGEADYKKVFHGDCLGSFSMTIRSQECPNSLAGGGNYRFIFPGASNKGHIGPSNFDCNANVSDNPQVAYSSTGDENLSRFSWSWRRNTVVQSEFAAVFFNRSFSSGNFLNPYGPKFGTNNDEDPSVHTDDDTITNTTVSNGAYRHACFINLASIGDSTRDGDTDGWRARWIPLNGLSAMKEDGFDNVNYLDKTIDEVFANQSFYRSPDYQVPGTLFTYSNRYIGTTKLARIMTSNSAKLPPVTGLNRDTAQRICSTYEVQVGIADDSGGWLGVDAPEKKRLMRRQEFVTAAAWPEAEENTASDDINYNTDYISSLEEGTANTEVGACNNLTSSKRGDNVSVNGSITTGMTNILLTGNDYNVPLIGGSSKQDSGEHTERCISKYGVQDLIGNVYESVSDRFTCDYSKDQLYVGKYSGDPVTNTGVGDKDESVPFSAQWGSEIKYYVRNDAFITFEDTDIPNITGITSWADIHPNSGYCSIVDNDADRVENSSNFREPSGIFKQVIKGDGSVNTDMIKIFNSTDQEGVNSFRNGDGFFMNWGQNNLAPQMSNSSTIALSGEGNNVALGPYFNPVIGMSLGCGSSGSYDSCNSFSSDNKLITTSFFDTNHEPEDAVIRDFPIGYSQAYSLGISAYTFLDNVQFTTYTAPSEVTINASNIRVISSFTVLGDGEDLSNYTVQYQTGNDIVTDVGPNSEFNVSAVQWTIERDSYMSMKSGGSYKSTQNGRYTVNTEVEASYKYRFDTGTRCMLKINEE